MLRKFCQKVVQCQSRGTNIQKCLRASYCSEAETELSDEETVTNLGNEFSFCQVTMMGRVGAEPKLVEANNRSFMTLIVGVNSRMASNKEYTKWHEIHVNEPSIQKQLMKNISLGDRVYLRGNLSYVQGEQYVKKYRVYCDYVRVVSRSQRYWDRVNEERNESEAL